jgi:hypothetical protein
MGLINLQTNLKSLRFGNDRFGNGNSGQPYIQTPIPDQLPRSGTEDFILRGGLNTIEDSATDVLRLGKYFADPRNPDGLLFIAKQNLLSRTAVRTQSSTGILNEGIYTPISTLVEAGGVAFGLHVNKQGLNPFDGIGSIGKYSEIVTPNQSIYTNRLIDFYSKIELKSSDDVNLYSYQGGPGSFLGVGNTNIKLVEPLYRTGINNAYGKEIVDGTYLTSREELTFDRTSDQFTDEAGQPFVSRFVNLSFEYNNFIINNYKNFDYNLTVYGPENNWLNDGYTVSNITNFSGKPSITFRGRGTAGVNTNATEITSENAKVYTYDEIINIPTSPTSNGESFYIGGGDIINGSNGLSGAITTPGDFRKKLRAQGFKGITAAPNYTTKNIEQRVNLGDPGSFVEKNINSYVNGSTPPNPSEGKSGGNASPNSYDKINVLPIYKSENAAKVNEAPVNDLVKFRIGVIDNNNPDKKAYIHFRAFLNQISDGYTADWASTQYIGRGEKFYNYTGFDRKVSLSWTVAAQSKAELIPMYKKLNYLASVCAPDYSGNGYLRGNIVTLTIGGYFYEQPGIITSFNYEMNDDNATWEIGINDADEGGNDSSVKELPHLIKVSGFNFIPIHNFVPRLQQNNFGTLNPDNVLIDGNTYGPERYIALENQGDGREPSNTNNYGKFFRA